jgi:hypothetical protein
MAFEDSENLRHYDSAEDTSEKTAANLTRILLFIGAEGGGGPPGRGQG